MPVTFEKHLVKLPTRTVAVELLVLNQVVVAKLLDLPADVFGQVATAVARHFELQPDRLLWIEHVPAQHGPPTSMAESFTLVQFAFDHDTRELHGPHWRAITRAQTEALLGVQVPTAPPAVTVRVGDPAAARLPAEADRFLQETLPPGSSSQTTYQSSLKVFQEWAVHAELTPAGRTLMPRALQNDCLASFFAWLRSAQPGRTTGARAHRKTLSVDKKAAGRPRAYSDSAIALHLSVAKRYLAWLDGDALLASGVSSEAALKLLARKQRKRTLEPGRREAPAQIELIRDYWRRQAAAVLADDSPPPSSARARAAAERLRRDKHLECLRNQALVSVLFCTAGRASEILQMKKSGLRSPLPGSEYWTHVIRGKGGKERQLYLDAAAIADVSSYLKARQTAGDLRDGLWPSHNPRTPNGRIRYVTLWAIVRATARAVTAEQRLTQPDFPELKVSPHLFRHHRAQQLANAGARLDVIQTLLGHESIETTRNRYAQHTPDEIVMAQLARADEVADQRQNIDEVGFARDVPAPSLKRRRKGDDAKQTGSNPDWLALLR